METGRAEADLRKMGSATELTDHYLSIVHGKQEDEDIITSDFHSSFVVDTSCPQQDDRGRGSAVACPFRRRITCHDNNDVDDHLHQDNLHDFSCDSHCPRICAPLSSPCVITSTLPAGSSTRSCCPNIENIHNDISYKNNSFNDNSISKRRRVDSSAASRHVTSNNDNHHRSSSSFNSKRRISSSSFLTRPCALYLFTVLLILDLSDFRILISSSSSSSSSASGRTTASARSSSDNNNHVFDNVASTMRRYNGFLVNGAFHNKNGHHMSLLDGLTVSPLSMDSVFFDDSIGNQLTELTESSESDEQQGENISEEGQDDNLEGDDNPGHDNHDSVTVSRTVEPQMLQRLESKFLKLFGMTKRPHRVEESNKQRQIKIPKHILDLYQKQTGSELPTTNLNLPGRHTRTANTVRTFYHQPGNPKEPSYSWEGRENHIEFNLNSIPSMEKVTGAELRVPFTITVDHTNTFSDGVVVNSGNRESISVSGSSSVDGQGQPGQDERPLRAVRILVHDIVKPATSPESAKPPETHLLEPITYPIDSKHVVLSKRRNGTSSFWLTFDVFPAVARWMSNPEMNHGLVLEIVGVTNEGRIVPRETVVQRHNLRVKRDVDDDHRDSEDEASVVSSSAGGGGSAGGRGPNSIITTESSTSTTTISSANGSSSKSTRDSAELLSSSVPQTPSSTPSVVVSSSTSPTEVGVATDDGFIKPNEERKKTRKSAKKKAAANTASTSIVLFTYSDDGHNPVKTRDAKTLSRHYRSAQAQKRRKNQRNKNRKRNLCQRHAMFVDFQDVGWNDWIVAPPGYAAYYCAGECPFPMAEHLNATNHAVIQALVHSMNPALVPPPCCVPTKYTSLSLLYTDSSDKIVLKNYNEMIVDSCGCS